MATPLRELLLAIKVKVDKDAVKQTDVAFDHAADAARKFEGYSNRTLEPLKRVGAQLATNLRLAERIARVTPVLLQPGALPMTRAPEAPSDRKARELHEALGMSQGPRAPRPGQSLAAPDVSKFLDTRSGPARALGAFKEAASSALASAGAAADRFNAKFDRVTGAIFNARTAFAGLAVVVAATAIGHFVGSVVEAGAELHTMAKRTRLSVETLQVWREVAAGVNADSGAVTGAFRKLSQAMTLAGRGGKIQAKAFKDLGVEIKGRGVEDVLIDTGVALANLDDDAKATALAVQLLGPAGAALVPAFKGGADAVRKLTAELRENVVFSAEDAARLEEVGSATERATKKLTALKQRAIVVLLPLLEALASAFEAGSKWVLRMAKETSVLQTIFLAIAGGGLTRLVTMFVAWIARVGGARAALALLGQGLQTAAGFALRFIAPLLIIEDFLTFLAGGKSLFGRAFEEIFGAGGAKKTREEFLGFFQQLSEAAGQLTVALTGVTSSELFKGAASKALEGILAVLNLIGLALADNTQKADAMAASLQGHLASLGLGPTKEHVEQLNRDARPEELGGAKREPMTKGEQFARKAMVAVFGDPLETPAAKAREAANAEKIQRMRLEQQGIVPSPQAPPVPAAPVNLTDNRKIEVNVGSGASPGETGRAVGGAVSGELTKDRRQTLNAISG